MSINGSRTAGGSRSQKVVEAKRKVATLLLKKGLTTTQAAAQTRLSLHTVRRLQKDLQQQGKLPT